MKEIKKAFTSSKVRKSYRKARKTLLDKGKVLEHSFINYLESEIAPSISIAKFDDEFSEKDYYAKIAVFKNTYSMIIEFEKNNSYLNSKNKALKLIQIGKVTANVYSDSESRHLINTIAMNIYEDEFILSAYIWTCIHTKRYAEAAEKIIYFSSLYGSSSEKTASFKQALNARLPKENGNDYVNDCDESTETINVNSLKKYFLEQSDKYLGFYKKKDYEAISELVFDRFKNSDNIDEVVSFIDSDLKIAFNFPTNAIVLIMINTGKKFSANGKKSFETALADKAVSLKKNIMTVRAAFWAYYNQGNAKRSRELLSCLEEIANSNNDVKQLEFVRKKLTAYLFIDRDSINSLIDNASKFPSQSHKPISNNIAYVLHNTLPYASGGYATRAHGLAEALQEKGSTVNMVARPGFPLDIKKDLNAKSIKGIQFIDGLKYIFTLHPRRDKTVLLEFIKEASESLTDVFLEINPSIIVAASNHLTALPALIAARKLGIPFIYEVRGFWEITRISREPEFANTEFYKILCELESVVATRADHVFTLTTPMVEELVLRGVNKDNITLLPNSCNPERFEPKSRDNELSIRLSIPSTVPVIGYIGTFVQYEGLDHLAEACGLLKKDGLEFRLLIVGNENTAGNDKGSITENILKVAKQYNFEDWLIMPGRIPHEEVEAYYSLIDIAPFPRKPQPVTEMVSPMKPLEAAAMKKAIVVSSVRALTDMITDGINGLVFEKGNVEDLANKLLQLINSEDLRIELGKNARKWVEEERTWDITAEIMSEQLKRFEHSQG